MGFFKDRRAYRALLTTEVPSKAERYPVRPELQPLVRTLLDQRRFYNEYAAQDDAAQVRMELITIEINGWRIMKVEPD